MPNAVDAGHIGAGLGGCAGGGLGLSLAGFLFLLNCARAAW